MRLLVLLLLPFTLSAQDRGDWLECMIGVEQAVDWTPSWQKEKDAVVMLAFGRRGFCTGVLINNTALDGRALILSAGHCGRSHRGDDDLRVWFFHEEERQARFVDGVKTLVKTNDRNVDVWLMELQGDVPEGAYFAGWSRHSGQVMHDISDLSPKEKAIYQLLIDGREIDEHEPYGILQHPRGVKKMIAVSERRVMYSSRISHMWWEVGSTAPGSSGSPVFDSRGLMVNMLIGGGSMCWNRVHDRLENFDNLYTHIKKYLDPVGLDLMELPGKPNQL